MLIKSRLKRTVLPALLCAAASQAAALEIEINNLSAQEAVFAFSYLHQDSNKWVTEGWYNVAPESSGVLTLPSNNDIYYLYAELDNGQTIFDPRGLSMAVSDKEFYYAGGEELSFKTRLVHFIRTTANDGHAVININN